MAKDVFYFPHDYDPTSDPRMQALVGEFGAIGYGVFWRLVEMLHADENHKLPLKPYIFIAIAQQMRLSDEQVQNIVMRSIDIFELFESDTECFWSNRVFRNIQKRKELSHTRSKSGKLGAEAKKTKQMLSKP